MTASPPDPPGSTWLANVAATCTANSRNSGSRGRTEPSWLTVPAVQSSIVLAAASPIQARSARATLSEPASSSGPVPDQQHDQRHRDADRQPGADQVGPPAPRPADPGIGIGRGGDRDHVGGGHRVAASRGSALTTVDPLRLRSDCMVQSPMPRR